MQAASYGGLEFKALRDELDAARHERAVLMQHATRLEQQLGGGDGEILQAALGACMPTDVAGAGVAAGAASSGDSAPKGPRKLSWNKPKGGPAAGGNAHDGRSHGAPQQTVQLYSNNGGLAPATPEQSTAAQTTLLSPRGLLAARTATAVMHPNGGDTSSRALTVAEGPRTDNDGNSPMQPGGTSSAAPNQRLAGGAVPAPPAAAATGVVAVPAANTVADGAVEEAVRRRVLRDVLASLLGEHQGSRLDHYQLDVKSVVAVAKGQVQSAVQDARAAAESAAAASVRVRDERALKEVEERAAKKAADAHKSSEDAIRYWQVQVEKAKRDADAAYREKKHAQGKAAQQASELREAVAELESVKQQLANALEQARRSSKAATKSAQDLERLRVDADARVRDADAAAARSATEAAVAATAGERALAQQRREQEAATSAAAAAAAKLHVLFQHSRTAAAAHAELVQEVTAEVDELVMAAGGAVMDDVSALAQELAAIKVQASHQVSALRAELGTTRSDLFAAAAATKEVVQSLSAHLRDSRQEVSQLSGALAAEPGGALGALAELMEGRVLLKQAGTQRAELSRQLQDAIVERDALSAGRRAYEEQAMAHQRAVHGVQAELAAVQAQLAQQAAEAAELRGKLTGVHAELVGKRGDVAALSSQLAALTERHQLLDSETTCLRQALAQQATAAVAASALGARQATMAAASALMELRLRYFQRLPDQSMHQTGRPPRSRSASSVPLPASAPLSPGVPPPPSGGSPHQSTPFAWQDGAAAVSPSSCGTGAGGTGSSGGTAGSAPPDATWRPTWGGTIATLYDFESAAGLRMCDLSHEDVVGALQAYLARQAHRQQDRSSGSDGDAYDPSVDDLLSDELLWLEGCVLVALLELRQCERDTSSSSSVQHAHDGRAAPAGKSGFSNMRDRHASQAQATLASQRATGDTSASAAKALAAQLLRSLADDRRTLQSRVRRLETNTPPPNYSVSSTSSSALGSSHCAASMSLQNTSTTTTTTTMATTAGRGHSAKHQQAPAAVGAAAARAGDAAGTTLVARTRPQSGASSSGWVGGTSASLNNGGGQTTAAYNSNSTAGTAAGATNRCTAAGGTTGQRHSSSSHEMPHLGAADLSRESSCSGGGADGGSGSAAGLRPTRSFTGIRSLSVGTLMQLRRPGSADVPPIERASVSSLQGSSTVHQASSSVPPSKSAPSGYDEVDEVMAILGGGRRT